MAGRPTVLKGQKKSVYFSGEQLAEMEERGLEPSEVVRRGLLYREPVEAPPDLHDSLALVARLAEALAHGGRVIYGDPNGDAPNEGH